MKKNILCIISVITSVLLSSCTNPDSGGLYPPLPTQKKLQILVTGSKEENIVKNFIYEHVDETKLDFEVEVVNFTSENEDSLQGLDTFINKYGLDSCLTFTNDSLSTLGPSFYNNYVVNFNDILDSSILSKLNANVMEATKYNGEVNFIPLGWSTTAVAYNELWFKEKYGDKLNTKLSEFSNIKVFFEEVNNNWDHINETFCTSNFHQLKHFVYDFLLSKNVVLDSSNTEANILYIKGLVDECLSNLTCVRANKSIYINKNGMALFFSNDIGPELDSEYNCFLSTISDDYIGLFNGISYIQHPSKRNEKDEIDDFVAKLIKEMILNDQFIKDINNCIVRSHTPWIATTNSLLNDSNYINELVSTGNSAKFLAKVINNNVIENLAFISEPLNRIKAECFGQGIFNWLLDPNLYQFNTRNCATDILNKINVAIG